MNCSEGRGQPKCFPEAPSCCVFSPLLLQSLQTKPSSGLKAFEHIPTGHSFDNNDNQREIFTLKRIYSSHLFLAKSMALVICTRILKTGFQHLFFQVTEHYQRKLELWSQPVRTKAGYHLSLEEATCYHSGACQGQTHAPLPNPSRPCTCHRQLWQRSS